MTENLVFGRVPKYTYIDHPIRKLAGVGRDPQDEQRKVTGVVLHRMIGTLRGTATYFHYPSVAALTEYGVGTLYQDGAADDGVIIQWNDPLGTQISWASGTYSSHAYGDGAAFVAKYGVGGINRDQLAIEISGTTYTTPVSDKCLQSVAQIIAYWADQYEVPYNVFPISPKDGFSFIRWHNEFGPDNGTKLCPGSVIENATPRIIDMVKAILRQYQVQAVTTPTTYAPANVIRDPNKKNAKWDGTYDLVVDKRSFFGLKQPVNVKGTSKDAECHVYADNASLLTRKNLSVGEQFTAIGWCVGQKVGNDNRWWITKYYSRIPVAYTDAKPNNTPTTADDTADVGDNSVIINGIIHYIDRRQLITTHKANVRSSPTTKSKVTRTFDKGIKFDVVSWCVGEEVNNHTSWWRTAEGDYVWSDAASTYPDEADKGSSGINK